VGFAVNSKKAAKISMAALMASESAYVASRDSTTVWSSRVPADSNHKPPACPVFL